ncbi:MAG: hypothetical protein P8L66_12600 [Rhodospirillaceae bacterium]|nr:hypothetical protein [Rhodospirillaceae bacterium]
MANITIPTYQPNRNAPLMLFLTQKIIVNRTPFLLTAAGQRRKARYDVSVARQLQV